MFGLLVVTKMLFNVSKLGHAASTVRHAATFLEAELEALKLQDIQEEQKYGFNREEERWRNEKYGGVEPLFPFFFEKGEVTDLEEVLEEKVEGYFVFRVSEWHAFVMWMERTYNKRRVVGMDCRYLLHCGRRRWENSKIRSEAFKNVRTYPEVLDEVEGVVRQEV